MPNTKLYWIFHIQNTDSSNLTKWLRTSPLERNCDGCHNNVHLVNPNLWSQNLNHAYEKLQSCGILHSQFALLFQTDPQSYWRIPWIFLPTCWRVRLFCRGTCPSTYALSPSSCRFSLGTGSFSPVQYNHLLTYTVYMDRCKVYQNITRMKAWIRKLQTVLHPFPSTKVGFPFVLHYFDTAASYVSDSINLSTRNKTSRNVPS